MLPHYHILIGLLLGSFLDLPNNILLLVIFGSVLPDLDFLLASYLKVNHRTLPTHYPSLWISFTLVSLLLSKYIFWICFAGCVHLLIDIIDWELYLFRPFSNKTWSLISLNTKNILRQKSIREFLIAYYSTPWILFFEISTLLLFTVMFFLG